MVKCKLLLLIQVLLILVLVNKGKDAFKMQQLAANKLQIQQEYVGVASTGVIGKMMPMSILENGFSKLVKTVMLMTLQKRY